MKMTSKFSFRSWRHVKETDTKRNIYTIGCLVTQEPKCNIITCDLWNIYTEQSNTGNNTIMLAEIHGWLNTNSRIPIKQSFLPNNLSINNLST
jgi:hypothetical protein